MIPPNLAARLASGTERAPLEVIYNGNALEQSLVRSEIESDVARGNLAFSEQIQRVAASAIEGLLKGGKLQELGISQLPIGLEAIPPTLERIIAREPPGQTRTQLQQINEVARFASENLAASKQVLSAIGQPIAVNSKLLHGRRTPLNRFAVVVAVSISLMLVGVLLAAGSVRPGAGGGGARAAAAGARIADAADLREGPAGGGVRVRAGLRAARRDRRRSWPWNGRGRGCGWRPWRGRRSPSGRSG